MPQNLVRQSREESWDNFCGRTNKNFILIQKLFYNMLKNQRKLIPQNIAIMERWRQYFQELLNAITEGQLTQIPKDK